MSLVNKVKKGDSNADLVQDLSDLSVFGQRHSNLLEMCNFDINLIETLRFKTSECGQTLAKWNNTRKSTAKSGITRNKAYTYLKCAVDEVREIGKYTFRDNPAKQIGYTSEQMRYNNARREKKTNNNTSLS